VIALLALFACNPTGPGSYDRRDTVPEGEGNEPQPEQEETCADTLPAARLVRRLSQLEYTNTVMDLVGVAPTTEFAGDGAVNGYDNNAATLTIGAVQADQYRVSAEYLAAGAVAKSWAKVVPCDEETRDCALEFVTDFGTKAYRRPLSTEEVDTYMAVYDAIVGEDGFERSIQWLIAGFLQSPYFLYRTELGTRQDGNNFALSDWEIASELSYMFWGTMPDERLFELAAAGELHTAEQIATEAERLVLDQRAAAAASRFLGLWMPTERVKDVVRSTDLYPNFTDEIRQAMRDEFERNAQEAYWNGLGIGDLLLADWSMMSAELAAYYGVKADPKTAGPDGWMRVDLAKTGGGLLTRGALMASLATPTTSSPIHRGKFVREKLLCQTMPPPPNDIEIVVPEYTEGATTRSLYEAYTLANEDCAGCHDLMDRIGFGFENYDGDGTYRATDQGSVVDASGEIVRSPHSDGTFTGPGELAAILAASEDVDTCYVKNWLEYATGVQVDLDAICTQEMAVKVRENGGGLAGTLVTLASLPDLRVRLGEASELDGPAPAVAK
jgi:hypothetical protein